MAFNWYSVPLAVVLAIPMYGKCSSSGSNYSDFSCQRCATVYGIAFMMAVVGLSLPEATLLKKIMTRKLIGIFFGVISIFIILLGYLFNVIL